MIHVQYLSTRLCSITFNKTVNWMLTNIRNLICLVLYFMFSCGLCSRSSGCRRHKCQCPPSIPSCASNWLTWSFRDLPHTGCWGGSHWTGSTANHACRSLCTGTHASSSSSSSIVQLPMSMLLISVSTLSCHLLYGFVFYFVSLVVILPTSKFFCFQKIPIFMEM